MCQLMKFELTNQNTDMKKGVVDLLSVILFIVISFRFIGMNNACGHMVSCTLYIYLCC